MDTLGAQESESTKQNIYTDIRVNESYNHGYR